MSVTIDRNGITVSRGATDDPDSWSENPDRWTDEQIEAWNGLVERSPQATVFHRHGSLAAQADHAGADLHPLVGYKGQEAVGIFPVFETRTGGMSMAFSPAPSLWVSYLGPALLNHRKLKRRKRERRTKRFLGGVFDWLDREVDPKYTQVQTGTTFADVRPFEWHDHDLDVRHTYEVDLTVGEDDLLDSFSSDARGNIRTEGDYRIYEGGPADVEAIIGQVQARHEAQDEAYGVTADFVIDLYERLPDGAVRPYALAVDGEFAGGMVALEDEDTVYRWQGGAKHDHDLPVNDLVDWAIVTDAMDRGVERYDLVGANEERLCGYKAKFAPELETYYAISDGSRVTNALSSVYEKFR